MALLFAWKASSFGHYFYFGKFCTSDASPNSSVVSSIYNKYIPFIQIQTTQTTLIFVFIYFHYHSYYTFAFARTNEHKSYIDISGMPCHTDLRYSIGNYGIYLLELDESSLLAESSSICGNIYSYWYDQKPSMCLLCGWEIEWFVANTAKYVI